MIISFHGASFVHLSPNHIFPNDVVVRDFCPICSPRFLALKSMGNLHGFHKFSLVFTIADSILSQDGVEHHAEEWSKINIQVVRCISNTK